MSAPLSFLSRDIGDAVAKTKGDVTAAKRRRVKREDCKEYVQNQVADVLQDAMDKAKRQVLRGDLTTLKTLWQMGGLDKQRPRERKRRGGLGVQILKRLNERAGG